MEYKVNAAGIITSPGKFEGEPRYVPQFWEADPDETLDTPDGTTLYVVFPKLDDIKAFPELAGVHAVVMTEYNNGLVSSTTFTLDEYNEFLRELDEAHDPCQDWEDGACGEADSIER